jgi:hypothetical protein
MVSLDEDPMRVVRRNKLLGMWAAEKLGLVGESANAYSTDLAMGTLDFERSDVLSKIRKDFNAAGVVQSDEEFRRVIDESWIQASSPRQARRGDVGDAAVVQIARNLMAR